MEELKEILNYRIFTLGENIFSVKSLIVLISILLIGRVLFSILSRFVLNPFYKRKKLDEGRQEGLTTLLKYLFYVFLFITAFQVSGFNLTVLLAAGAALLVGVGIGLQQTFNDLISGIILLTEGSVKPGDWVEIESTQGKVINIGLRTSLIETRSRIVIIVPNSKLTVDNVVNLSHNNESIRYKVEVGVAYNSDVPKVMKAILQSIIDYPEVLKDPAPSVRLSNFGESSLDIELLFWSNEYHRIDDVKSKIRCGITEIFRKEQIEIPYPQRDLHVRSNNAKF